MTQGPDFPLTPPPIPASLASLIGPLTHCPHCRYDLTGLPRNHRCPECGQPYDETMLEFRTAVSLSARLAAPAFLTLLTTTLCFICLAPSPRVSVLGAFLQSGLMGLFLGGGVAGVIALASRSGRCYLTPAGLTHVVGGPTLRAPWDAVCDMRANLGLTLDREIQIDLRFLGTVVVQRRRLPISCNAAMAKQLVEYLRKYRNHAIARLQNGPVGRNGVAIPDAQKPSSEP